MDKPTRRNLLCRVGQAAAIIGAAIGFLNNQQPIAWLCVTAVLTFELALEK
jgi:hypothetical protein